MSEGFGIRSLHPSVLAAYYAGGIALGMLLFHPLVLLAGAAASLAVNAALDGGRAWRRGAPAFVPMLLLVIILNPLVSHRGRTVLAYLGDMPVTLESVVYGATLAVSLLNLLTLFVSYRLVVTEQKFLYLFAGLSPKTALLAMMATGLVPRLRRRLGELMLVQRTRGITVAAGPLASRVRSGMRLMQALLAWTLEDALQTADSMQARGYGTGPRSAYPDYRFRPRDRWALAALGAAAACALAAWALGFGSLRIYPRLEGLRLSGGDAAALLAYAVYVLLPLVWEWRDRKAWRSWNSTK